jgi:A/G-specific adenine glycosylase
MTRKTSPVLTLASDPQGFEKALLAWYDRSKRPLPWRVEASLYRTVVSEFMCQQTQIKTVLPYFARRMEALPDFRALAKAPEGQVLKLWEGLGYYSRARNLQKVGRAIAGMAKPPTDAASWRELPGIGPYTAAAITSISFGATEPCVDGNVVRILSRLGADGTEYRDSATAAKAFTPLAEKVMSHARPGDHNQAMMELGATVCTKGNPLCTLCPVMAWCEGQRQGNPEAYPRLTPKKTEKKEVLRVWCTQNGSLLLHRMPEGSRRLALIHELPTAEQAGISEETAGAGPLLGRHKRAITRFQITESIHRAPPPRGLAQNLVWIPLADLPAVSLSGPHRRWIQALLAQGAI